MQDLGISILFKGINFQRLLGGLWVTLRLALITIGLSCLFGLLFALLMLSRRKIARFFCRLWLEIVRFMPQLVLLYIVYFGFARLFGWDLDGETSAVIVFTFWGTAEMGDLIRGALTSIPRHQTESAAALGLTKGQIYLHVLIPQTLRRLLPQAINLSTRIIKTTALVKMINVTEVLKGWAADYRPVLPSAGRGLLGVLSDLPALFPGVLALLSAGQTPGKALGVKGGIRHG